MEQNKLTLTLFFFFFFFFLLGTLGIHEEGHFFRATRGQVSEGLT